jgi:hypothetical protein
MSTMTTLAPWNTHVEQTLVPAAALRFTGDVCPQLDVRSIDRGYDIAPSFGSFLGAEGGVAVVTDERRTGTPAWSPPDCR